MGRKKKLEKVESRLEEVNSFTDIGRIPTNYLEIMACFQLQSGKTGLLLSLYMHFVGFYQKRIIGVGKNL